MISILTQLYILLGCLVIAILYTNHKRLICWFRPDLFFGVYLINEDTSITDEIYFKNKDAFYKIKVNGVEKSYNKNFFHMRKGVMTYHWRYDSTDALDLTKFESTFDPAVQEAKLKAGYLNFWDSDFFHNFVQILLVGIAIGILVIFYYVQKNDSVVNSIAPGIQSYCQNVSIAISNLRTSYPVI